ncbi:MAG: phosphatidylserine decarboxylase family protein [Pseudomonadota bacterium]
MKMVNSDRWPAKAGFPVARPGLVFVFTACCVTGLFFWVGWTLLGWPSLAVTLFIVWFFRDPDRTVPDERQALISPADGKIISVGPVAVNPYMTGVWVKVSIFMNVFNVHVNRVPFSGVVEKAEYFPGRFFNASLDKASEHNERNALVIRMASGKTYAVVQIAGLIARRIVCAIQSGDSLERGHRYGMIRFGSRLDLYLPEDTDIAVSLGDKVKAGESIIGIIK